MKIANTVLRSNKLSLRVFESNNLHDVFIGLSNENVIKYYGISCHSLASAKEQLCWFADLQNQGKGIWWAVSSADGDLFYGAIGFNNLSLEHKKTEIGFWLLPEFWGKGIIFEAINLVSDYAFNSLNISRIEAFVELENLKSSQVLLKTGFSHEGTMKKCEIKNGKFISLSIYAKLKAGR